MIELPQKPTPKPSSWWLDRMYESGKKDFNNNPVKNEPKDSMIGGTVMAIGALLWLLIILVGVIVVLPLLVAGMPAIGIHGLLGIIALLLASIAFRGGK